MLIYPIQVVVNTPVEAGAMLAENLATRERLLAENARLKRENLLLSSKSQRFLALERENERLRELLDSSVVFDQEVIAADVLAIETTPSSRQIVINKGTNQGAFVGQPVLDAYGVIGQIAFVGPFSSTALLVTDPRHALPVLINRNGLRAVAVGGDNPQELTLSFVSTNADVKVGDLLVTSGLGRRFPPGYPVGKAKDVSIAPGEPFATVVVEPSAKVGQSREVLLVGPRAPNSTPSASAASNPERRNMDKPHRLWVIVLSFRRLHAHRNAAAVVGARLASGRIALVLVYWCLALPERVGVLAGWSIGLVLDVLNGSILGQHAFGLAFVAYVALQYHRRVRVYPCCSRPCSSHRGFSLLAHDALDLRFARHRALRFGLPAGRGDDGTAVALGLRHPARRAPSRTGGVNGTQRARRHRARAPLAARSSRDFRSAGQARPGGRCRVGAREHAPARP